jgi:hypothetical protein
MNSNPMVSVLMPVYNGERYVAQAVESILAQTFTNFEFIIIDDGSTDASGSILQSFADRDDRICLIRRDNKGLIKTLNEMLKLAKGEFLARMDADDISTPTRLERQIEFLTHHPDVVCVGGAYELMDSKGRTVMTATMPQDNAEIQHMILIGRTIINHPCAMIRRAALMAIGGYDETMLTVEDLDMLLRLGEIGKLANIKEVVLRYRFHTNSVSAKNIVFQDQMAQEACRRAWKRRGIQGHYDAPPPWFRPGPDPVSQQSFLHRYGWWAFCSGLRVTAAACGIQAIAVRPSTVESWKLLACALIKPIPRPKSV